MKNTQLSRVQKIIYAIGLVSMVVAMIVIMAGCDGAGGLGEAPGVDAGGAEAGQASEVGPCTQWGCQDNGASGCTMICLSHDPTQAPKCPTSLPCGK